QTAGIENDATYGAFFALAFRRRIEPRRPLLRRRTHTNACAAHLCHAGSAGWRSLRRRLRDWRRVAVALALFGTADCPRIDPPEAEPHHHTGRDHFRELVPVAGSRMAELDPPPHGHGASSNGAPLP